MQALNWMMTHMHLKSYHSALHFNSQLSRHLFQSQKIVLTDLLCDHTSYLHVSRSVLPNALSEGRPGVLSKLAASLGSPSPLLRVQGHSAGSRLMLNSQRNPTSAGQPASLPYVKDRPCRAWAHVHEAEGIAGAVLPAALEGDGLLTGRLPGRSALP